MAQVEVERIVDAPLSEVWASWDNFGDIRIFNPNLSDSFLINGSQPTGLGAMRQCDMKDGKNYIRERIVGYEPERRLEIDIYEGTLPMKDLRAVFTFDALGPARTRVTMTMHFTPGMGFVGRLALPLMKAQMARLLGGLLTGNKAYVERGETVVA